MFYIIPLDTNNWGPVTKCIVIQPNGCTGKKRSFDRIPTSQIQHCEVSGILGAVKGTISILGAVKGTISIDINKRNVHFQYFIIIPLSYLDTRGHKYDASLHRNF